MIFSISPPMAKAREFYSRYESRTTCGLTPPLAGRGRFRSRQTSMYFVNAVRAAALLVKAR